MMSELPLFLFFLINFFFRELLESDSNAPIFTEELKEQFGAVRLKYPRER